MAQMNHEVGLSEVFTKICVLCVHTIINKSDYLRKMESQCYNDEASNKNIPHPCSIKQGLLTNLSLSLSNLCGCMTREACRKGQGFWCTLFFGKKERPSLGSIETIPCKHVHIGHSRVGPAQTRHWSKL